MSRRFGTVLFISGMFVLRTHNEHSTEGHSPETSEHLLRFWHFHQHSSLFLFIEATSATGAAYEVVLAIICTNEFDLHENEHVGGNMSA